MPSTRITFDNGPGKQLVARLDLPVDDAPDAYAILAHCFTCSKDLKGLRGLSSALCQAGLAVLSVDFTGLGQSEGDLAETTFSSNLTDLEAAARYLAEKYQAPSLLVGHSLGGAAVLAVANEIPSVRAVATIGAPADPVHVEKLLAGGRKEIDSRGEAVVNIGDRPFTIRREFLDGLSRSGLPECLGKLDLPLLIIHSPSDEHVGIDNARRLFDAARHPKSFLSLDGADHLLSVPEDARLAGGLIASWAQRYLEAPRQAEWKHDPHDNRVVARVETGLRTEVLANGFGLIADEPIAAGGTETGPTPYDLLAAALASCTAMTLRLYADRKEWPMESVQVKVRHRKVHFEDTIDDAEGRPPGGKLDRFERELELFGALDESQRARLLEIANRCPVHRTLEGGSIEISTSVLEKDASVEA